MIPEYYHYHVEWHDRETDRWVIDRSYTSHRSAVLWMNRLRKRGYFARVLPRSAPAKVEGELVRKSKREWIVNGRTKGRTNGNQKLQ